MTAAALRALLSLEGRKAVDKELGDRIPEFNKKAAGGGNVGISGASFSLGDHRTKLETIVILLIAVFIIGGTELLLGVFNVPHYVMPKPGKIALPLVTAFPTSLPLLLFNLQNV